MGTFILAVIFWPITLLYLFCAYVIPILFQVMIFLGYGAFVLFKEYPIAFLIASIVIGIWANKVEREEKKDKENETH